MSGGGPVFKDLLAICSKRLARQGHNMRNKMGFEQSPFLDRGANKLNPKGAAAHFFSRNIAQSSSPSPGTEGPIHSFYYFLNYFLFLCGNTL